MIHTIQWLKRLASAGFICACVPLVIGTAQGADSAVPTLWGVAPMTNGAYLESFDTALPVWAGRTGGSAVTNVFSPAITGLPARSNAWFGANNAKVLWLDTAGTVLTNSLLHQDNSAVSFASSSVYVDMKVKFDAVTDGPDANLMTDTKLALFVSSDCKLVAVHAGGWTTNSAGSFATIDTNKWYQLTIKMSAGKYNVLLNDQVVFSELSLKNGGTLNTLQAANFYGTGLIDELYISHGDPANAVKGPTNTVPTVAAGSNPPTDAEQFKINVWLNNNGVTSLTGLTQDQVSQAFLLNELADGKPNAVGYSFGVSEINLVSPTELTVTVSLLTDNGAKNGPINGKIQLLGQKTRTDDWTTLDGAITPSYENFTNGKATYTFDIPSGGYRFFKPQIVP